MGNKNLRKSELRQRRQRREKHIKQRIHEAVRKSKDKK